MYISRDEELSIYFKLFVDFPIGWLSAKEGGWKKSVPPE